MKTKIAIRAVDTVTYTTVANHLLNAVSKLPDYLARRQKRVCVAYGGRSGGGAGNSCGSQSVPIAHHGIFNSDWSIHTSQPPNQMPGMDPGDKKKVNDERARLGLGRNRKNPAQNGRVNVRHSANVINQLTVSNAKYKRTIAGLKSTGSEGSPTDIYVEMSDAWDEFGGKAKKARK